MLSYENFTQDIEEIKSLDLVFKKIARIYDYRHSFLYFSEPADWTEQGYIIKKIAVNSRDVDSEECIFHWCVEHMYDKDFDGNPILSVISLKDAHDELLKTKNTLKNVKRPIKNQYTSWTS